MTVEEWEAACIDYLTPKTDAQVPGNVWWHIMQVHNEPPPSDMRFGPEHPAVIAGNNQRRRDVMVSATDWINGQIGVALKPLADELWPVRE